jgi:hypothetical protein
MTHTLHGRHWLALDPPRHLVVFTRDSLTSLAEAVGLHDIRVTTTARAVALTHIASTKMRTEGHYQWGRWPGLSSWLRAQALQSWGALNVKLGRSEGEELVLIANK